MPHLFVRKPNDNEWLVLLLTEPTLRLVPSPERWLAGDGDASAERTGVLLFSRDPQHRSWVLAANGQSAVSVNGLPVHGGIRRLEDRDEIRVEGVGTYFFSAEERPRVEPYSAGTGACMRCKLPLPPGGPAVRCPVCGIWHHENADEGRRCWSEFDTCGSCCGTTAMSGGFRWSPEEL
jgi:hypothetical protein